MKKIADLPYFEKWFIYGLIIGISIGLIDLSLYYLNVYVIEKMIMEDIIGIQIPHPDKFIYFNYFLSLKRLIFVPIIVGISALISVLVSIAMKTKEVGSDIAIKAFHNGNKIKPIEIPASIISSSITIGLGGSAGREGPASHAGAGIGQLIINFFGGNPEDRRLATAVGMGAAIGVIFKTPLAGAFLAGELLYKRDIEPNVIYPGLIASSVGYVLFSSVTGFSPIFGTYTLPFSPERLPLYIILGLICGGIAVLYPSLLFGIKKFMDSKYKNQIEKALIGGVIAGIIALVFPEVMGEGYGWLWEISNYNMAPSLFPFILTIFLLPFAKILATSFTIGSGAKGGIFAPGIVIGGFTGLAVGFAFHFMFPSIVSSPMPFMIVGMLSTLGVAVNAPFSVIIMVVEMTGGLQLLPAEMIGLASAYLVARNSKGLFVEQPFNRSESPAHSLEFSIPLLTKIKVSDVKISKIYLKPTDNVKKAMNMMNSLNLFSLPIVDDLNNLVGIVMLSNIIKAKEDEWVAKYATPAPNYIRLNSSIYEALESMKNSRYAIVMENGKFQGILLLDDIANTYREYMEKLKINNR
ncbi:chloride channel protein EriC [Caldisphaera lagunensis DSM 15908]|uniref:Chloride channel protein EriC n=1 Tax=Caldisphaera lagunensis (strain DSM 15908 / JCM 11604 / ANMR 0165 / IC-154) TaxID=1056495 RepID=L0A855_CALLD|nr:chloride channel protein [Caldisphaera lagunensis]AFZ70053.1 chloride channel protein EriC [Caldisphaera lagunensis DSM 15908]